MISFIVKIFINFSKNYTAGSIHPEFHTPAGPTGAWSNKKLFSPSGRQFRVAFFPSAPSPRGEI